jgi:NAD(P)-dependent dehydrogenase (short-subunit alcohol dehydrogenase family)
MASAGCGVIVNMGSTNGIVGYPFYADYNASKAGVLELTRSMALELALVGFRLPLRSPSFRLAWHTRLLSVPVAGRLILGLNTARFASTLGILTSSGVPLIRALDAGARTLGNDALRQVLDDAIERVREGAPLSRALAAGVLYVPGEICFCADDERAAPRHAMRLSFGAAQPAELVRGTQLLSQALAGS